MSSGFQIGARLAALADIAADDPSANGRVLDDLVSLFADRPADLPFLIQLAADFAWLSHPGRFADDGIEAAVARLSATLRTPDFKRLAGHARPRVLHVLTQAQALGGHTRLAWRWMAEDKYRAHSVAITGQAGSQVPRQLATTAVAAGGRVEIVGGVEKPFLARAGRLRELAAGNDFVVLHVEPWDAVAMTALAEWPEGPPVLFVNHADHVFWAGGSVADVVVCLRGSGADLAMRRRGVAQSHIAIVPIPVPPPRPLVDESAAIRASLGVARESVLAVSAGSAYKYTPMRGLDFAEEARALVRMAPTLRIVVVGPPPSGRWSRVEAETDGRVRAVGPRHDLDALLAGADIYLDAFPFASLTALLEAARLGVPVVSPALHPPEAAVLGSDSPNLDDVLVRPTSTSAYRDQVASLVAEPADRRRIGEAGSVAVRETNSGALWRQALEVAYGAAEQARASRQSRADLAIGPNSELDARLVELHVGFRGLRRPLRAHLPLASQVTRLALFSAMARRGRRLPFDAYVPAKARPALRALVRRT